MRYAGKYLAVSHRWFNPRAPDADGLQLRKVREYLRAHKDIEWVWYDYWCMPQGESRTPAQKVAFKVMLSNINWLYIGCSVLVLLDLSYLSRFWTQFEAWLALQVTSAEGLKGGRNTGSSIGRTVIVPIYNANSTIRAHLISMWESKSPDEAHAILSEADVTVTNLSDKEMQLPKILALDEEVRTVLSGPAADTQPVSNEKTDSAAKDPVATGSDPFPSVSPQNPSKGPSHLNGEVPPADSAWHALFPPRPESRRTSTSRPDRRTSRNQARDLTA